MKIPKGNAEKLAGKHYPYMHLERVAQKIHYLMAQISDFMKQLYEYY